MSKLQNPKNPSVAASDVDTGKIPSEFYDSIMAVLPIASVEAVISKGGSYLFLWRENSPVKGQWWFPGGRIRKGETLAETLYREVKEETGLEVIESELVNVYSRVFDERHDITIVYLCKCKGERIVLNNEHSKYKYFKEFPPSLHPHLVQVMHDIQEKGLLSGSANGGAVSGITQNGSE